jgi:hypothetical protein
MTTATANPTLAFKVRASRAVPELGLSPGEVMAVSVTAECMDLGAKVHRLTESGALEYVESGLNPDDVIAVMDAFMLRLGFTAAELAEMKAKAKQASQRGAA